MPVHKRMTGLFVLFGLYVLGVGVANWLKLQIPGSILGMVLLLLFLFVRRGELPSVRAAADPVLALIPLFLIPICVSMAMSLAIGRLSVWITILAIAVSTVLGVVVTLLVAKRPLGRDDA
jgi:holin-like protein